MNKETDRLIDELITPAIKIINAVNEALPIDEEAEKFVSAKIRANDKNAKRIIIKKVQS